MLTHPTIDQLRALRLDGMADAFIELQTQDHAKDLGPAEWLALMLDREAAHRGTQPLVGAIFGTECIAVRQQYPLAIQIDDRRIIQQTTTRQLFESLADQEIAIAVHDVTGAATGTEVALGTADARALRQSAIHARIGQQDQGT